MGHTFPPVLMGSFSQHVAVIFFIPPFISDESCREGMADKACPFPTQTHPVRTRTNNGSTSLRMVVSSKSNLFFYFQQLASLPGRLYVYQINKKQNLFGDHEMPLASLRMIWGLIKTSCRLLDIADNATISE